MSILRPLAFAVVGLGAVVVWFLLAPATAQWYGVESVRAVGPASVGVDYPALTVQALADSAANKLMISAALADFETNNKAADSAPKQQVVNGWVARDLLSIIANQNADQDAILSIIARENADLVRASVPDRRISALLVLGVLAICLSGVFGARTRAALHAVGPDVAGDAI